MKHISEYNGGMTEYEFFSYLYDRIITREVTSFSKLKEIITPALKDRWTHPAIMRAFLLLKHLNWGFFASISPNSHKKLWKEIVIQDKDFPEAGDIKKTLQISNLYVVMLDIHGYTRFCMESRKNLSMMHSLDWAIENEIKRISTQCGAISMRERGDEIVVVAASAVDAIMVTLCIIDYFNKTNVVNDPEISAKRAGAAETLPLFKISAGITGGYTQSPLIITERGNLAGFLLNSGARLQTRASELSPKESRIMVAKQVMMNYDKENASTPCILSTNKSICFIDTGHIEFKGVMIPTCEVVFDRKERYKEKFAEDMTTLFASIRDNLWEQKIFQDMMDLLINVAVAMPKFSVKLSQPINGMQIISNESYIHICHYAANVYCVQEDYYLAVEYLDHLIFISEQINSFDRLILDYLKGITGKYKILLASFEERIKKEVDDKAELIFGSHYNTWVASKNALQKYDKMLSIGLKSKEITKKKYLWLNCLLQNKDKMEFTLYSGKK